MNVSYHVLSMLNHHIQPLFFGSTWFDGNRMEKSHGLGMLGLDLRLMVVLKPFAKRNRQNPRCTRPWDYFMQKMVHFFWAEDHVEMQRLHIQDLV